MIEPKSATNEIHRGWVYWISPYGNVVETKRNFKLNTTVNHKTMEFPHDKMNNGLWTVVYIDSTGKPNILNFLMVGNQDNLEESEVKLFPYELDGLKSIKEATVDTEKWLKSTFVLQESCTIAQSCEFSSWSSRSPDQFSNIKL